MEIQRFSINGRVLPADDPQLQSALAQIYQTTARPRCLCVPGGVEVYVAHHRRFVAKRMPESRKSPSSDYEPDEQQSGLGELMGKAVLESEQGDVELRVDFPWTKTTGRGVPRTAPEDRSEFEVPRRRMSLRALMHFLFGVRDSIAGVRP